MKIVVQRQTTNDLSLLFPKCALLSLVGGNSTSVRRCSWYCCASRTKGPPGLQDESYMHTYSI